MHIKLPDFVFKALALLEAAGHQAWLVGGCVRDACLGMQPKDFDLTTSALPAQMKEAFAGYKTLDTGLRHGTLTLVLEGHPLEITTYRSDGRYSDRRHPDEVQFVTSLKEDLARRDFTANAMAWHPEKGLFDPFSGQEDCNQGLLRAVGQPALRFSEDALRILRGLRFACQLGFRLEEATRQAMLAAAPGLAAISPERIATELNKALRGRHANQALARYTDLLCLALPELSANEADLSLSLAVFSQLANDLPLLWAALYQGLGPQQADVLAKRLAWLKQPRALQEEAVLLLSLLDEQITQDQLQLQLSRLGLPSLMRLLCLQTAARAARGQDTLGTLALAGMAHTMAQAGVPLHLSDLAVDGQDLLALGFVPGPGLGQALNQLLDLVLTGKLQNDKRALCRQAEQILEDQHTG